MSTYLALIPPAIEEILGAERAVELRQRIMHATGLRMQALRIDARGEADLEALADAAGMFTALGAYLRATD